MKEDAPVPARVPRKRRDLHRALDVWLATWLARDDLSPGDRKRLDEERARRRDERRTGRRVVGFLGTPEGLTPAQRDAVRDLIGGATLAVHEENRRGSAAKFHGLCLSEGVPVELMPERDVIREADVVLAATRNERPPPRRMDADEGVWRPIRLARDRGVPVKIILPDGRVNEGDQQ